MLELADVYVISTCVANQYAADLTAGYAECDAPRPAPAGRSLAHELLLLAREAGQVARVVNALDGDKKPKRGEALDTVERAVSRLHLSVLRFADVLVSASLGSHPLTLDEAVDRVLAKSRARDVGRFAASYDPSMCAAVDAYAAHAHPRTNAAFSRGAKVWGAPAWDASLSDAANAARFATHAARFARVAPSEGLDAFVMETPADLVTDEERGMRFASSATQFVAGVQGPAPASDPAKRVRHSPGWSLPPQPWAGSDLARVTAAVHGASGLIVVRLGLGA